MAGGACAEDAGSTLTFITVQPLTGTIGAILLTQDYIGLILVYTIIAVSLASGLYLDRRGSDVDVRKVVHIGVGNFILVWWMFTEGWIMLAFFTIPFAILLFLAMLRDNAVSRSKLGELSNEKGHRTGLFLYAVSITLMILVFPEHWVAATFGIVAMTYGDGFGCVVGRRFGRHRIANGKSLEGSIGVFAATTVVCSVILVYYSFLAANGICGFSADCTPIVPGIVACMVAGLVASVAEALCHGSYDNIVIPMAVATAMVLMGL